MGSALGGIDIDLALLVGLLLTAAAGLADDLLGGISQWVRLVVQIVAAGLVVWRLGPLDALPLPPPVDVALGALGYPVAILWIVSVVNLTNFLDGIDGFAASQGLLAGAGLAVAALGRADAALTLVGVALAASCLGFLPHNRHPARVFLGDVGSSSIGFVLATATWVVPREACPETMFLTAMLIWFFLADGTWTLVGRALRGESFWKAHRQHLYQRLTRTGLDHARVCRRILALALLPAVPAVAGYHLSQPRLEWLALGGALVSFAILRRQVVAREGVA